jgi:hypothetical protein
MIGIRSFKSQNKGIFQWENYDSLQPASVENQVAKLGHWFRMYNNIKQGCKTI